MDNVARADWKYIKVDPDPNFDPEKNKRVVEEAIRETDALIRKKKRDFGEAIKERSNALASFLKAGEQGGKSTNMEKYFGKNYFMYLKGMDLLGKLKARYGSQKTNSEKEVL